MTGIVWQRRVIALAGLLQALDQVIAIARNGTPDETVMNQCIDSIFVQDPGSITEVYDGTRGIRQGLMLVDRVLSKMDLDDQGELLRYALAVLKLERSLAGQSAVLNTLGAGISRIARQRQLRDAADQTADSATIEALAELYQETLSRTAPRIKVSGKRDYLQNSTNTMRIRALLLAAVRAAVLWHQVGGRRWHLLLSRRKLVAGLQDLS